MRFLGMVALVAAMVFGGLLWWHGFPDPDAFYHAKVAQLLIVNGPLHAFPWLDLTTLGRTFVDQHFLFHVIEAFFVYFFGFANGTRITALILATGCVVGYAAIAKRLQLPWPWFWVLCLGLTAPFTVRMLLGKASPLAVLCFMVGLAGAWCKRPIWIFFASLIFVLSHGGWIFLTGSLVILVAGDFLYRRIIEHAPWRDAWKNYSAAFVAHGLGLTFGVLLHPNAKNLFSFLWIQVVKIGLGTPYAHVILGMEWLPYPPLQLFSSFAVWLILLLLGVSGIFFARRTPFDHEAARGVIAFGCLSAVLVALTLKSQRTAEYFTPVLALWIPWIWRMIDVERLFAILKEAVAPRWQRFVMPLVAGLMIALFLRASIAAFFGLHRGYADDIFQTAMQPISAAAHPGDRVFHSDWDEFPALFALDDRLRYVAGLDPTFLYEASSTLSDAYRDLTWGMTTPTHAEAWNLIHDRLKARFVLVAKKDHAKLAEFFREDPRFRVLADTDDAVTFIVEGL